MGIMSGEVLDISRLWKGLSLALMLIVSFILFHSKVSDFDIWWHLAGGKWIARNLGVPALDPFSFTSSTREWIDLHWLFQLMVYASYRVAGSEGLILVRTAFLMAALVMVVLYGYRGSSLFAALFGGLVFILVGQGNFVTRPYIVTLFFLASLLFILDTHSRRRGREVFLIIPVMLAWVNCHGLFVTGLGVIAAWGTGEFLDSLRRKRLREDSRYIIRLTVSSALALAVCLVNPYHVEGFLFPLELWTRISGEIEAFTQGVTEFTSPFAIPVWVGPVFFYKISLLVILAALLLRGRKVRSAEVIIVIMFAYISYKAVRNLSIWAAIAGPVIGRNVGETLHDIKSRFPSRARLLNHVLYAALCMVLCAHVVVYFHTGIRHRLYGPSMFGSGILPGRFPEGAADFMEINNLHGKGFNCFEDGGYLIWRLGPGGFKTFIDGRLEVHDEEMYATYRESLAGPENLSATLDKFNLDYAVLRHNAAYNAAGLALRPDWAPVFLDDVSLLIVRGIPEHEELIRSNRIDLLNMSPGEARKPAKGKGFAGDNLEDMGVVFMGLGRTDIARAFFKEAALTPGHERAELFMGMDALSRGRLDEAKARLERALKGSPENRGGIHSMLAEIAQKENDAAGEVRHLRKALRHDPDDCSLRERLGLAYMREGFAEKASSELEASLECPAPENIKARRWMALGMALLGEGRLDDAERAARKAIEIDPGLAPAKQMLDEIQKRQNQVR